MKKTELIHQHIGKLFVTDEIKRTTKSKLYKCICECGNIRYHTKQNLLKGTLVSCGCHKLNCKGNKHKNWKGIGDLSRNFVCKIKSVANRRKISFLVSIEYLWELFQKQNGKCALSGLSINLPVSHYDVGHGIATASLDRINSSLGYIEGNVQWVHKEVNMMKQQLSQSRFIELCNLIVNNIKHA
jgi:hypothetical protein